MSGNKLEVGPNDGPDQRVDALKDAIGHWATEARTATVRRDETIRQAIAAGAGQREIARAAQLSHTAIARIVQKATA